MPEALPRILITTGDPAGIGPEIALKTAASGLPAGMACVAFIGDRDMLKTRAEALAATTGIKVKVVDYSDSPQQSQQPGVLAVIHHACRSAAIAGQLNAANSPYVIRCIDAAVDLCRAGEFDAMATGPVNKAIINQAGIAFSGHTEWIAARCGAASPVMMLANSAMRMCLLSNHVPLTEAPRWVTPKRLRVVIHVILNDLRNLFQIQRPTVGVCGLNPHAGEGGYIGREEIEVITPTLDELRLQHRHDARIIGPISADTAFTAARAACFDAMLAMYHDQGLPAIKSVGFGETVNITLGLPIIRTSVDHGTAVELAGAFTASESSLRAAMEMARELAAHKMAAGKRSAEPLGG